MEGHNFHFWLIFLWQDIFVAGSIPQLGHESFQLREKATSQIKKAVPFGYGLVKSATKSKDLETAQRAKYLCLPTDLLIVDIVSRSTKPTSYPCLPWINPDILNKININRYLNMAPADSECKEFPGPYANWRCATKFWLKDFYSQGGSRVEAIKLLDDMVEAERKYIRSAGKNYNPPLKEMK